MRNTRGVTFVLVVITFVVGWLLVLPERGVAQVTCNSQGGNNAVWGPCGGQTGIIGSGAFVDASRTTQGTDICDTLYQLLRLSTTSAGTVIDARGITTPQTCSNGKSPWFESGTGYVSKPSTILLPAGTITIPYNWILPSGTRLIGQGADLAGSQQTVIRCTGTLCTSSNAMIQFGGTGTFACSPSPCAGISVEHVTLDGANSTTVTGIENANSQDQTYVDHVTLWQILGTGLYIHGNAQNSGPYSNITYDTNTVGSGTATCANINSVNGGTHGIHGLTCKSGSYSPVAVYLDSSNNTLEDVRIVGFNDGILVGSRATAQSNVLLNIVGDTNFGDGVVINVVHIASGSTTVSDLSMVAVANQGTGAFTIRDDRTAPSAPLNDPHVALYALGKSAPEGYSRFTTSPKAATWIFGTLAPPNGTCAVGSLYSNSSSGGLYVCDRTSAWVLVKN